jgi:hypothetical protein
MLTGDTIRFMDAIGELKGYVIRRPNSIHVCQTEKRYKQWFNQSFNYDYEFISFSSGRAYTIRLLLTETCR